MSRSVVDEVAHRLADETRIGVHAHGADGRGIRLDLPQRSQALPLGEEDVVEIDIEDAPRIVLA